MSFDLSLAQPYLSPFSSPAVLGEALLDCHAPPSPPRRCAATGQSLPQPIPLSLLDQGVGDVTPRRCAATGQSLPQPIPLSLLDQGVGDVTGLHVC